LVNCSGYISVKFGEIVTHSGLELGALFQDPPPDFRKSVWIYIVVCRAQMEARVSVSICHVGLDRSCKVSDIQTEEVESVLVILSRGIFLYSQPHEIPHVFDCADPLKLKEDRIVGHFLTDVCYKSGEFT